MEKFIQFIQDWFFNLSAGQKRRIAVVSTIVFAGLFSLIVFITAFSSGSEKPITRSDKINIISPIPPEEIFLPDEPDFIPGTLLERDRRLIWTEEDASAFWQDPLRFGEEQWRDKLEAAIDEFLERVP